MGAVQQSGEGAESEGAQRDELLLPAAVVGIQYEYAPFLQPYEDARPGRQCGVEYGPDIQQGFHMGSECGLQIRPDQEYEVQLPVVIQCHH